jgi:uncharacterized phage-associated protein
MVRKMTTVFDVACYILHRVGKTTTMKLQKLIYYAQSWSLVWDEEPLFLSDFEAWANGPVIPELFNAHRGVFTLNRDFFDGYGDETRLTEEQRETIDVVLKDYNGFTPAELSSLTHKEAPWKNARTNVPSGVASKNIISKEDLQQYYGGI